MIEFVERNEQRNDLWEKMEREYWAYLDGTNNLYEISNFGNVRSTRTKRNLAQQIKANSNAVVVSLHNKNLNGGKRIKKFVAHEVYKHFADKNFVFDNYKVYHLDGNIRNNKITNLAVLDCIHHKATQEQLQIYSKNIYKYVKKICHKKYNIKGFDTENLIQQSAVTIWKYLPDFKVINKSKNGFYGFCKHYVEMVAIPLLKQYHEYRLFNDFENKIY